MFFVLIYANLCYIYKIKVNKEVIKIKKAGVMALGGGILAVGITAGLFFAIPKEKIKLSIEGDKLTWIDNSKANLLDCYYYIYNDEFLVNKVTEHNYLLTSDKLIDEAGPDKIKKININYAQDKIDLEWGDANDLGTINNIRVFLYGKNERQIAYSNKIEKNFASDIDKYIVNFEDVEYEVWDNKFSVKVSQLKDGITMIKLYAIDKRGNIGTITNIPLYNYKIILS